MPVFDNGVLDLTELPSAPVLWLNGLVDTLCLPLQCSPWRTWLNISTTADGTSMWRHVIPPMTSVSPVMMTWADFRQQQQQQDDDERINSSWLSWCHSLLQYAFVQESTSLGVLTTPTACLTLLLFTWMIRTVKSLLQPYFLTLGRSAARSTHGPDWERSPTNQARIVKFGEYLFRLLYHTVVSVYGVGYFWDKPWWQRGGTLSLFRGFPNQPVAPGMAWYYLLQAAYNLDALLSLLQLSFVIQFHRPSTHQPPQHDTNSNNNNNNHHHNHHHQNHTKQPSLTDRSRRFFFPLTIAWSPTVRGDFREMFVHHLVTNILIVGSSHFRLTRIGSMVFLVHDISDIPVDLSKLANFLKWKYTTVACFLTMMLVWMATRLYILPFVIYRAILTESHYTLESGFPPLLYVCYRHWFYVLMAFLILLHLSWFGMFLQMLHTIVTKNENHDYSEHKHGEHDDEAEDYPPGVAAREKKTA